MIKVTGQKNGFEKKCVGSRCSFFKFIDLPYTLSLKVNYEIVTEWKNILGG